MVLGRSVCVRLGYSGFRVGLGFIVSVRLGEDLKLGFCF